MIDVKEHFYNDDPSKGHPDVQCYRLMGFFACGYVANKILIRDKHINGELNAIQDSLSGM